MSTIVVTGVPGTGKSELSKKLAVKLSWKYVDVNKIIKKKKLRTGWDSKRHCYIVNEKKLASVLAHEVLDARKKEKSLILDSHMAQFVPPKYVDLVIVTKCELRTLYTRLKRRGYSEKKIRENIDAEIFDVCANEASDVGHTLLVVFTDKNVNLAQITKRINQHLHKTEDPLETITFTKAAAKKMEKRGMAAIEEDAKIRKKKAKEAKKKPAKKKATKKKPAKKKKAVKKTKPKKAKKITKKKTKKPVKKRVKAKKKASRSKKKR